MLTISAKSVPVFERMIANPDPAELRELARHHERTTQFGSASYVTKFKSRGAADTRTTVDGQVTDADIQMIEEVKAYLQDQEVIQLDGLMGMSTGMGSLHCRLYVTREYARLALLLQSSLYPTPTPEAEPDFITIDVPEWPGGRSIIVDTNEGVTYVLGSDYYGEIKKSFLRQTMYRAKQEGQLGLHAGSKVVVAKSALDGQLKESGILFFGLSGTGKTSLTCHSFDLDESAGEYVRVRQDDVVILASDGFCKGTEGGGFYIKTDALNPEDQGALYGSAVSPRALFENVWVEEDGTVDFYSEELTSNGRAVVPIDAVLNTDDTIDVERVTHIYFITRNPLMPAVCRLDSRQAAVAFMLGESIKTSAADPSAKGEPVRSVGTNPFIVGPKGEEGRVFYEILLANPGMRSYILNTGKIGEGEDALKIKLSDTVGILRAIAREQVDWIHDDASGLEVPATVPGVDTAKFRLADNFEAGELVLRLAELRQERVAWLAQFDGFPAELAEAVY
ncbi:MAG: phosphoenolpyruvate carboxykinase [Gemmatimonadota bacterium]